MDMFKKGPGRTGLVAVFAGLSIYAAVNTFQGPLEKASTDHKPTAQAMVEEQNPEQAKTSEPSQQARNTTKPTEHEKQRSMERMNTTRTADRSDLSAWNPLNSGGGKA